MFQFFVRIIVPLTQLLMQDSTKCPSGVLIVTIRRIIILIALKGMDELKWH